MKSGLIGSVRGDFTAVQSVQTTVSQGEHELQQCLDIQRVFSTPGGSMAFEGRAAVEVVRTRETAEIDGVEVTVATERGKETRFTNFVGIPGEFVVVDSGKGTFAFDLLAEETGTEIERGAFDIESFYERHPDASTWKAGFTGTGEASNSIIYGENLGESQEFERLHTGENLTQLGVGHDYDGRQVKMTATRNGYAAVYDPSEFESGEFLDYVRDQLVQYTE